MSRFPVVLICLGGAMLAGCGGAVPGSSSPQTEVSGTVSPAAGQSDVPVDTATRVLAVSGPLAAFERPHQASDRIPAPLAEEILRNDPKSDLADSRRVLADLGHNYAASKYIPASHAGPVQVWVVPSDTGFLLYSTIGGGIPDIEFDARDEFRAGAVPLHIADPDQSGAGEAIVAIGLLPNDVASVAIIDSSGSRVPGLMGEGAFVAQLADPSKFVTTVEFTLEDGTIERVDTPGGPPDLK